MNQLIIIDVQQNFIQSKSLVDKILKYSKEFDYIVYIYDTMDGSPSDPYDMWENMKKDYLSGKFCPIIINKQYDFFRDLIDDEAYSDEFIVSLIQLMIKNNIENGEEILLEENYLNDDLNNLCEKFNVLTPDFFAKHDTFYIPNELKNELDSKISNNCVLVGGGINECLKEISILLKALNIEHTINKNFCY